MEFQIMVLRLLTAILIAVSLSTRTDYKISPELIITDSENLIKKLRDEKEKQ